MGEETPELPRRRHRLLIDVGADTPEAIVQALREIDLWAHEEGLAARLSTSGCQSIMGGSDAGWSIASEFRPEVTHDGYFEALEALKVAKRGPWRAG